MEVICRFGFWAGARSGLVLILAKCSPRIYANLPRMWSTLNEIVAGSIPADRLRRLLNSNVVPFMLLPAMSVKVVAVPAPWRGFARASMSGLPAQSGAGCGVRGAGRRAALRLAWRCALAAWGWRAEGGA